MKDLIITVKTLFGFEDILKDELKELGYDKVEILNRAVQLNGNWEDVYRLNYRCRLAISVLVQIKSFNVHKEDDLYKEAKKIDWPAYFDVDKTFAVKGAVFSSLFTHTQYPFLVVKDAIADVFREQCDDKRPDVNLKSPQVMFDVYIKEKNVVVSLNTSGVPLFQRGYRQEVGEAPMNEVLAAGILRLSGWDRKSTLIDPMCGAGTIAIEAALWAADIPAMIERGHFAFKNFKSFDAEAWKRVKNEGNNRPIKLGFDILASDSDGEMIKKARRNSRMAPIGNMVTWDIKDALELEAPDDKGILIVNPPYGERIGEEVEELYTEMGDLFKQKFLGYDCWVVSSNIDALKNIGLRPSRKIKVFNGNLECSLRQFQVFAGSKKYDNSEDEADGVVPKPRGVRREKRKKVERVVEEHENEETTSMDTAVESESEKESGEDKKEYKPTRRVIETPSSDNPRKSAASRYGQAKSSYLPVEDEESVAQSEKEKDKESGVEKKEYNPTRVVIETPEVEPRKSAASKYGQAKSAYLPVEDSTKEKVEKEVTPADSKDDETPVKSEKTEKEPRLGAAKYGSTPKFMAAAEGDKKEEETTEDKVTEDHSDFEDDFEENKEDEMTLKDKIAEMKKSRKGEE
ncbi:THUMP domain-containing class I SAM-dependent RNA methyltransferase [Brumimicrobium mesophilum]|uniref:THUMP domain-containing class I SAM-dependent RNA methyltransferase n=1 Tax=Brumimicrobium mesophilum TaxID=392717 RepID=UPI000D13EF33|nr:THUMP domain-containing protein [Brumimicrobium mesophilum]